MALLQLRKIKVRNQLPTDDEDDEEYHQKETKKCQQKMTIEIIKKM